MVFIPTSIGGPGRVARSVVLPFLALALLFPVAGCQELLVSGPPASIPASARAAKMAYLDGDELWVLDLAEDISVRIATGVAPGACRPYHVSPDGDWIAHFAADGRPWLSSTDGARSFRLAEQPVSFLAWYPDSQAIAYKAGQQIYIRRIGQAGEPQAFSMSGLDVASPAWSPGGKHIAFLEAAGEDLFKVLSFEPESESLRSLGSVSLAVTGTVASLADCAELLAWSPDSTKFLMSLDASALIFYLSGGNPILVGPSSPIVECRWSQDSRGLALVDDLQRLWTVGADGSSLSQVSRQAIRGFCWSPDGHALAYSTAEGGGMENVYVVELPGGAKRRLTAGNAYRKVQPQWAPDGSLIVFQRLTPQGEPAGIWAASARDGSSRLLVNRGSHPVIFESRRR